MNMSPESYSDQELGNSSFTDDLNFYVATVAISLTIWMAAGRQISLQLTHLPGLRGIDEFEIRDRVSVALLIALIPICAMFSPTKTGVFRFKALKTSISWLAFGMMFISFAWITHYNTGSIGIVWDGFGEKVALIALVFTTLLVFLQNSPSIISGLDTKNFQKTLNPIAGIIAVGLYLPSVFQFPRGIIGLHATNWALNEFIAPLTGHIPFSNFTSEYSSLLGLPLLIFKGIASVSSIPIITTMYVNSLVVIELILLARLINKIFPRMMFGFCFAIPTILSFVKVQPNEVQTSSIAEAMTAMPARTLLPIIVLTLLVKWATEGNSRRQMVWSLLTGLATGFTVINNFEFGFTAMLAILPIVFLGSICSAQYFQTRDAVLFLAAIVGAFVIFKFGMMLTGNEFQVSRLIAYTKTFGKLSFGNIPMPTFGLFIFFYVTLSISAILGLRSSRWFSGKKADEISITSAQIISVFVGVWSSLAMFYYAGRSTNAGQLQLFLIPLSLAICSIVKLHLVAAGKSNGLSTLLKSGSILIFFFVSVPIAALMQSPSPSFEFSRWTSSEFSWTVESIRSSEAGRAVVDFVAANPNVRVGYFGKNPNLTQLALGVQSVLGVNDPFDLWMSPVISELACADIGKYDPQIVVVPVGQVPDTVRESLCALEGLSYQGKSQDNMLELYRYSP